MARRKKGIKIDGWINLNKPIEITSTQAVGKIRRALNVQKIGHGGTLDPLASGILPIALGEATKTINFIQDALKTYEFEITWGEQRSTDDAEGDVIHSSDKRPTIEEINTILPRFTGEIDQIPPQFSAIKINGERAYDIARDGQEVEIKSRNTYIKSLEIMSGLSKHGEPSHPTQDRTSFECICGKGTYIRSLARDMGQILGCYGYISGLKRTKVGVFDLENTISLDIFQKMIDNPGLSEDTNDIVLPLQTVLDDIPVLALKDQEAIKVKNGNSVSLLSKPDLMRLENINIDWKSDEITTALATYEDLALAMVKIEGSQIHPVRVFNM